MKSVKIYLIIVTILLIVAILLGVYVWYMLQTLQKEELGRIPAVTEKSTQEVPQTTTSSTILAPEAEAPVTIQKADLSEGQQKALDTLGIEGTAFTISPESITCAKNTLGSERYEAITSGAPPTTLESIRLLGCFKK